MKIKKFIFMFCFIQIVSCKNSNGEVDTKTNYTCAYLNSYSQKILGSASETSGCWQMLKLEKFDSTSGSWSDISSQAMSQNVNVLSVIDTSKNYTNMCSIQNSSVTMNCSYNSQNVICGQNGSPDNITGIYKSSLHFSPSSSINNGKLQIITYTDSTISSPSSRITFTRADDSNIIDSNSLGCSLYLNRL